VIAALGGQPHQIPDHGSDDTIAGMAARALATAPPRFCVAAHAMGGFVAFEILRRAPERVARLALLGTLAPSDTPAQTERRLGYARLVEAGRFDQVVEERIPILLHPERRGDAALLAKVRRMAQETGAERFLRQQRAVMSRPDSRPDLPKIRVPTLILWGRQDGIAALEHQREMERGIAGARLEIVEECGHLLTLERPEHVALLLRGWFAAGGPA